jgi:hypothetical protein
MPAATGFADLLVETIEVVAAASSSSLLALLLEPDLLSLVEADELDLLDLLDDPFLCFDPASAHAWLVTSALRTSEIRTGLVPVVRRMRVTFHTCR